MKNIIKRILLATILLLALLAGAYYYYVSTSITPYQRTKLREKIVDYEFIEDGQALVMKWEYENPLEAEVAKINKKISTSNGPIVGKSKIVRVARKLESVDWNRHNTPKNQEYWELRVYDIKNQKLTYKDYDVFQLARKTDSRYVPVEVGGLIYFYEGKEYMELLFRSSEDGFQELIYKAFDLESGEVIDRHDLNEVKGEDFYYLNELPVVDDKLIPGPRRLRLKEGETLDSQSLLKQEYPKAYDLLNSKQSNMAILTDTTEIKTVTPILQLLFKKDTNLFKGATVPSVFSIDGKDHVVNSQEEFIKYYKRSELNN